jgi:hypothetical protein
MPSVQPSNDHYYDKVSKHKCLIQSSDRFLYGLLDNHGELTFGVACSFESGSTGGNFEQGSAEECVGVLARECHKLLALKPTTSSTKEYHKHVIEFAACAIFASHLFVKGLRGDVSITSLCFKCLEELRSLGKHLQDPRLP